MLERQGQPKGDVRDGCPYDGKNPVDPSIANPLSDEPEEKRRYRDAQSDQQSPHTHKPGPLILKEGLGDHGTPQGAGGADEEGNKRTAGRHGGIVRAFSTTNIAYKTPDERNEEDGTTAVSVGQGLPEQRGAAEDGDL